MRAIIYCRTSTLKQNGANQIAPLIEYANRIGYEVIDVVRDDGISGSISGRDRIGFSSILDRSTPKTFDILLVFSLDRISREGESPMVEYVNHLTNNGIEIYSHSEGAIDCEIARKVGAFARLEGEMQSLRIKAGLDRSKNGGSRLGRPPCVIDLKRLKELRKDGLGVRKIAKELNISYGTVYRKCKDLCI